MRSIEDMVLDYFYKYGSVFRNEISSHRPTIIGRVYS